MCKQTLMLFYQEEEESEFTDIGCCQLVHFNGALELKRNTTLILKNARQQEEDSTLSSEHWLDRVARLIFPFSFVLFLLGFLLYYGG